MLLNTPIVIRQREIADDELQRMLLSACAAGDTVDFFGKFEYFAPDHPFITLERGEALLRKCQQLAPDVYKTLHKGTPFYWLSQAAFLVRDYETAAFYIMQQSPKISESIQQAGQV